VLYTNFIKREQRLL